MQLLIIRYFLGSSRCRPSSTSSTSTSRRSIRDRLPDAIEQQASMRAQRGASNRLPRRPQAQQASTPTTTTPFIPQDVFRLVVRLEAQKVIGEVDVSALERKFRVPLGYSDEDAARKQEKLDLEVSRDNALSCLLKGVCLAGELMFRSCSEPAGSRRLRSRGPLAPRGPRARAPIRDLRVSHRARSVPVVVSDALQNEYHCTGKVLLYGNIKNQIQVVFVSLSKGISLYLFACMAPLPFSVIPWKSGDKSLLLLKASQNT